MLASPLNYDFIEVKSQVPYKTNKPKNIKVETSDEGHNFFEDERQVLWSSEYFLSG
jgi:hypothetical protein